MLNHPPVLITAVAAVVVALSACSGGSDEAATSPSPSATSATNESTPSTTTPASPTTTQAPTRTVLEVKAALLALDDLPSGFAIDPAGDSGDGGAAKSADPRCAPLVKLMNAKKAPGSKASASVSFSGGQDGPFIEESIDSQASADAVEALQTSFKTAIAACRQLTITIPGQGSSAMKVVQVSAPEFGDHTLAARLTATGGSLDGLEITQVTAGVKDVVLSMTFVAAIAEDVDGGMEAAVGKAEDVLGGASPGA